jgi:hypothetical protein
MHQKLDELERLSKDTTRAFEAEEIADLQILRRLDMSLTDIRLEVKNKPIIESHESENQKWRVYWPHKTLMNSTLEMVFTPKRDDQGFLFEFAQAVGVFPIFSIRRCLECGNWYVRKSKHVSLYCSLNCRSRKNVRDWRSSKKEGGTVDLALAKERASHSGDTSSIKDRSVRRIIPASKQNQLKSEATEGNMGAGKAKQDSSLTGSEKRIRHINVPPKKSRRPEE